MMRLDDEAVKIMEEATAIVAEDTRSKFPDLPLLDGKRNPNRTEKSASIY